MSWWYFLVGPSGVCHGLADSWWCELCGLWRGDCWARSCPVME